MRSEFEEHFLSLKFATGAYNKLILDSCIFDPDQDGYLPKVKWNSDECIIYCCMLNTAYLSFKQHQSEVDNLEHENTLLRNKILALESKLRVYPKYVQQLKDRNAELQKQVDAVKQLIIDYKDPSITSDKSFQHGLLLVVMELEQALKGDEK